MAETQDTPRSDDSGSTDPLSQLRNDYKNLSNNAQQLLTEKLYLENEAIIENLNLRVRGK